MRPPRSVEGLQRRYIIYIYSEKEGEEQGEGLVLFRMNSDIRLEKICAPGQDDLWESPANYAANNNLVIDYLLDRNTRWVFTLTHDKSFKGIPVGKVPLGDKGDWMEYRPVTRKEVKYHTLLKRAGISIQELSIYGKNVKEI